MTTPRSRDLTPKMRRLDHGEVHAENHSLTSTLWERLPEHLIEEILAKLPLSSLVRFCGVCKRWRNSILSSEISPRCTSDHGRLFYISDDKELKIFSSSRGTWETAPLEFVAKEFDLRDIVASAGGLLCFCTGIYGEFIVCNPITKCYKRLEMPFGEALAAINDFQECLLWNSLLWNRTSELLVGMILDPNTRHFQLVVGSLDSSSRGTALLFDSSNNSWKKVGDTPTGAHFFKSRPLSCGRNLFFFFPCGGNGNNILKYDSGEQSWSWIPFPEQEGLSTVIEQSGKIVLITAPSKNLAMLQRFELQDSQPLSWLPVAPLNMTTVSGPSSHRRICDLVGQGDVMFWTLARTSETYGSQTGEIRVWFQINAMGSFDILSNWECSGSDTGHPWCQIFKPSLLLIK